MRGKIGLRACRGGESESGRLRRGALPPKRYFDAGINNNIGPGLRGRDRARLPVQLLDALVAHAVICHDRGIGDGDFVYDTFLGPVHLGDMATCQG